MKNQDYEEVPPDPASTVEALRSLGYSPESAFADLIDNSISAGSFKIEVRLHWSGSGSWCAVVDDGIGMSETALTEAMRIGSSDPLAEREWGDLGRFGMGLKTASFSQCREVTVTSRVASGRVPHIRSWDLDHVREVGRWDLRPRYFSEVARPLYWDPESVFKRTNWTRDVVVANRGPRLVEA